MASTNHYGWSFEQLEPPRRCPVSESPYGYLRDILSETEFSLRQFLVRRGCRTALQFFNNVQGTLFVGKGAIVLEQIEANGHTVLFQVDSGTSMAMPASVPHRILGIEESLVYFIGSSPLEGATYYLEESSPLDPLHVTSRSVQPTRGGTEVFDRRQKYWGEIETIVSERYAAKRLRIKKGSCGSLEFHCKKKEAYFIESGEVKVGIRVGRARNTSIMLRPGEVLVIPPGLMHCRIGVEEAVIIEVSTEDSDADSFLVEDGRTYRHVDSEEVYTK